MDKSLTKHSDGSLFLSIVIIGRNEEDTLPGLFKSLPISQDIEWIYVDSQSGDNSAIIALEAGAKVLIVDKDSVYSASTGRYVGTLEAAGRWVLYLDGDMALSEKFKSFIDYLRKNENRIPPGIAGFLGKTRNIYQTENGKIIATRDHVVLPEKELGSIEDWGKTASYHGGAVLYKRSDVVNAGNWNPSVYQLEEIDLYSRVRKNGLVIRAIDLPMADHFTPHLSIYDKFKMAFLPRWGDKRLYGAGQVVKANATNGLLGNFIRHYPYPFLVFAGLVLSPLFFIIWPYLPLFFNSLVFVWIGYKKKWYFYLVYLGNIFQILYGLGSYEPVLPFYQEITVPKINS